MNRRPDTGPDGLPLTGLTFAIVGAGRLGTSLALAMRRAGATLNGYVCASPEGANRAAGWLEMEAAAGLAGLLETHPSLIAICVPDSELPGAAAELGAALAEHRRTRQSREGSPLAPRVLHTSGAGSVRLLAPCAEAGAATLAFHPLQTFSEPGTGSTRFAGCAIAITADEDSPRSPAALFGFELAEALGARPFLLQDDKKALYHAAACTASNYLVTLESVAERLFVESGLPADDAMNLFLPLVRAAVDNLAAQGAVKALTGPLSRGDVNTIAGHLETLDESYSEIAALYRSLGIATLDLVSAAGQVDPSTITALRTLLSTPGAVPKTQTPR